jgi:hypothetical protein
MPPVVRKHCATLQGGTHAGDHAWYTCRRSRLVHMWRSRLVHIGRLWVVHINTVNDNPQDQLEVELEGCNDGRGDEWVSECWSAVRFFILALPTDAFLATVGFLFRKIILVKQAFIFCEPGIAISCCPAGKRQVRSNAKSGWKAAFSPFRNNLASTSSKKNMHDPSGSGQCLIVEERD